MSTTGPIDYDSLDPGIRGDVPHVHMLVRPERMIVEADRVLFALRAVEVEPKGMSIQATYDPLDGVAVLSLYGVRAEDFR